MATWTGIKERVSRILKELPTWSNADAEGFRLEAETARWEIGQLQEEVSELTSENQDLRETVAAQSQRLAHLSALLRVKEAA